MGEQKLVQDLGVQKINREKADRDGVNTGHVIQKRNKAIKEGGGVTTKAQHTDPVHENPTFNRREFLLRGGQNARETGAIL